MIGLTDLQRSVLREILAHQMVHGSPPTLEKLRQASGLKSINATYTHVQALLRKGYIQHEDARCGTLRLVGVVWQPVFDAHSKPGVVLAKLCREITGEDAVLFELKEEALT